MSVTRPAGVDGTFPVRFSQQPVGTPALTIYQDAAQTQVAVPSAPLAATGNPLVWTASYPSTLPAGRYYLQVAARYTAGEPLVFDTNDVLDLTDPATTVDEDAPPLATVDAFEARLGRTLDGADRARAQAALEDASSLARDVASTTYLDQTAVRTPVPGPIRSVVLAAARRAFDNPNGYASENLGSYSYSRDAAFSRGGVYLTAEEKRTIRRAANRLGIGTLQIRRHNTEGLDDVLVVDAHGHLSPDLMPFPTTALGGDR